MSVLGGASTAASHAAVRAARLARFTLLQPHEPVVCHVSEGTTSEVAQAAATPAFQSLPDGALFRVTANLDLPTCAALNAGDNASRAMTATALQALQDGIAQVKQEHVATTDAIEHERSTERQIHAAEGEAHAQVLQILEPLRDRLNDRFAIQVTELFGLLEQASQTQQLPPEVEAAFEARIAEASASALAREAEVRSRVADGDMQQMRGITA
jgi:hypothetical protein